MTEITLARFSNDRHTLLYCTIVIFDCVLCYKSPICMFKEAAGPFRTNAKMPLQGQSFWYDKERKAMKKRSMDE